MKCHWTGNFRIPVMSLYSQTGFKITTVAVRIAVTGVRIKVSARRDAKLDGDGVLFN